MQVPNQAPSASCQLTLKQRPSKSKAQIDDKNPVSVSGEREISDADMQAPN
jgi:hypothetical protein